MILESSLPCIELERQIPSLHLSPGQRNWKLWTKILNFLEIRLGVWCFLSLITRICTEVLCEDCSGPWFRDHKYDKKNHKYSQVFSESRRSGSSWSGRFCDGLTGLCQNTTRTDLHITSFQVLTNHNGLPCNTINKSKQIPYKSLFRTFSPEVNKAIPTLDHQGKQQGFFHMTSSTLTPQSQAAAIIIRMQQV